MAVVESGSLLSASDRLGVSRATLRRRLDALEGRIGAPLFSREAGDISLSQAGKTLAEEGRFLIQEAAALMESVREVGTEPSGLLRILAPVGMPPHFAALLVSQLRLRHPQVSVQLGLIDNPLENLIDEVDLIFHFGASPPQGPWITTSLLKLDERLVAARSYLDANGTPACLEDLHQHTLLCWASPGRDPARWPLYGGGDLSVRPGLVSPDIHMVRQCMLAGVGIAMIPDAGLPDPGWPPGEAVHLFPGVVGQDCTFRALIPEALAEIPKTRAALRVLREFLGEI